MRHKSNVIKSMVDKAHYVDFNLKCMRYQPPKQYDEQRINELLDLLDQTALKMYDSSEMMINMKEHFTIQKHGAELMGAYEMIEEWIRGIKSELK